MGEREDNEIPKGPDWLRSPAWWIGIAGLAVVIVAVRWISNGGPVI